MQLQTSCLCYNSVHNINRRPLLSHSGNTEMPKRSCPLLAMNCLVAFSNSGSTTNEVRGDFRRHFSDVQWWHSGVVSDGIQRLGTRLQALLGSKRPGDTPTSDAPMAYQALTGVSRPGLLFLSIHWTSEPCLQKSSPASARTHCKAFQLALFAFRRKVIVSMPRTLFVVEPL